MENTGTKQTTIMKRRRERFFLLYEFLCKTKRSVQQREMIWSTVQYTQLFLQGFLIKRFLDSLCSFFTTYLGRYVQYRDNILDHLPTQVSVLYHFPFFVTLFLRDSSLLQRKKNVKKRRRVNKQCMHTKACKLYHPNFLNQTKKRSIIQTDY